MKTLTNYVYMSFLLLLTTCFLGCEDNDIDVKPIPDRPTDPIVIVYENDVHCAVDGYAKFAALRSKQLESTSYVTTVSCGDFAQGDIVGAASRGESIVDIMNKVGYDVVTLGNHEFDYGMSQMFLLMERLNAPVVSANFRDLRTKELAFPAYQIVRYGEVDIAYIGFTTTTTTTSTTPKIFQDEAGNVIYDFSKETFYTDAQNYINEAREKGADYVVALAHLGDSDAGEHPNSLHLIANTTGIDVVLDGHDHHVIPYTLVNNQEGTPVLLSSTGTKFANIGLLTLSTDGTFSSRLVSAGADNELIDGEVQAYVDAISEQALAAGERVVGTSEVYLSINDESGNRIVRNQEANIGDFCADAFRIILNTDLAVVNGGGIRDNISQGEVTYNDCYSVFPFNNTACTATITGQQLLDALECTVRVLPQESGDFLQVSGMKFEVDASVPTPVVIGADELFSHVGEGTRRVSNLQILDQTTGEYKPVELENSYTIASYNYLLKELGAGGAFKHAVLKADNLGQDVEILVAYIEQILEGKIGSAYANADGRIVVKGL